MLINFRYFYSSKLEEVSFHGKTADYLFMILFGSTLILLIAPLFDLPFVSHSLVMMILYVWSRRNKHERLRLFGLFTIGASYLAYVMLGISMLFGGNIQVDLIGIFVGHIYFYFKDVIFPQFNVDILKTPYILTLLFPNDQIHHDEEDSNSEDELFENLGNENLGNEEIIQDDNN